MNRQTVAWMLLLLPALLAPLRAADPTGTISGSVLDSSNAPVPKARVLVTNTATGVKETVPGIKGATASAQIKPATLETGLVVNVPSFINEGDKIRVNTETGEYQSRV